MLKKFYILFVLSLLITGCSSYVYYETPVELKDQNKTNDFYTRYSKFLKGKTIFIDPGHGGSDRFSKGKLDMVVEADINLAVSLHLREFLIKTGAVVIMSRTKDTTIDLKDRSLLANASGADVFISVHHNAPGDANDSWTNYTSTYYHAKDTDYEYEPCERDIAKYVQRDMAYAMRNSGGPGSFDGTYSDYIIYPKAGFSVLRLTEIPSILVECGFFTNNFEERRLAKDEYNRIQAWGIFRGLARYFSSGIPEINYQGDSIFVEKKLELDLTIKDPSGIDSSSIHVYFDSVKINSHLFNSKTNKLTVLLDLLTPGDHILRVVAANKNGNHSFPFYKKIQILP